MPCFSFPNPKMACIHSCLWPFALVSMLLVAMFSFSGMNMSHRRIDSADLFLNQVIWIFPAHIQLINPMFLVCFEQPTFFCRLIQSISFLFIKSSLGNRFVSLHHNKFYPSMPCFSFPNPKMACIHSCLWPFALVSMLLVAMCSFSDCYDPLDPNGNFTITFDTYDWTDDGYLAKVTIQNFFQYRHVDKPGWQIGWIWQQNEVIWSMNGAFATEQGNCSNYKADIPHSCKKDPEILDLMPDASSDNKSEDCCRSGVLDALAINPSKSFSSFGIKVGNLGGAPFSGHPPLNLTLKAPGPGYTCGPFKSVDPTVSLDFGGRRQLQVFRTWKAICTYSSFLASHTPVCCVSLSSFYNPEITSCPKCSCGCREVTDRNFGTCLRPAYPLTAMSPTGDNPGANSMGALDLVKCTDHMCPIRVHWHVKTSYVDHWRIILTITNYNYERNFSNWNVLVQHPGLSMNPRTYSFNSALLQAGFGDAVALFWGLAFFNEELIATDEDGVGSVSTEILLEKDSESFTFKNGWAFPRRVYFNGENCEMPLPDTFPMLPNGTSKTQPPTHWLFLLLIFLISPTLLLHSL